MEEKKEEVFQLWDELMLLMELAALTSFNNESIMEIISIQSVKKEAWEIFYERRIRKPVLENIIINPNKDLIKEIILKWEEIVIEAYLCLQEARKRGGTLGHKIGPIWSFHKQEKEKYTNILLKI